MNDESDDRPWTEAQWEKSMRESDVKSAKFGELLETLMDDPNCQEIIAHEMGWDKHDDDEPPFEMPDLDDGMSDEEWKEECRRDEEALRAIPAYTQGYDWGLRVHDVLQPFVQAADEVQELEPDDPLVEAFSNPMIVAAKIAGGHGMGYEDDAICGNIVCCKRSLAAAEKSVAAMEELKGQGNIPAETIQSLLDEARQIRGLVEEHIAEMRSRVWWE